MDGLASFVGHAAGATQCAQAGRSAGLGEFAAHVAGRGGGGKPLNRLLKPLLHPPISYSRNSLATLIAISERSASEFLPNFKEIRPKLA
jgi:hypothetical protein